MKPLTLAGLAFLALSFLGGGKQEPPPPPPTPPPPPPKPTQPPLTAISRTQLERQSREAEIAPLTELPTKRAAPGETQIIKGNGSSTMIFGGFLGEPTPQAPLPTDISAEQLFYYLPKYPSILKKRFSITIDNYRSYHALANLFAICLLDLVAPAEQQDQKIAFLRNWLKGNNYRLHNDLLWTFAERIYKKIGSEDYHTRLKYPAKVAKYIDGYGANPDRIVFGESKTFIATEAIPNAVISDDRGWLLELAALRAGSLIVLQTVNPQAAQEELQNTLGTVAAVGNVLKLASVAIQGGGLIVSGILTMIQGIATIVQSGQAQKRLEEATITASDMLETALIYFGHTFDDLPASRLQLWTPGGHFAHSKIWRTFYYSEPLALTRKEFLQIPYWYHQQPFRIPRGIFAGNIGWIGPYGTRPGPNTITNLDRDGVER